MSMHAQKPTLEDYLAWDNDQLEKHEFYRGEIFAMVGARRVHGEVSLNIATALKTHLRGGACRVFVESMKVKVADDAIFYPDVFVTCNAQDLTTDLIFHHPLLVVEVLSESTQAFDRGLKFAAYRQLVSMQEYALVDPATRRVEIFRRNERELFELHDQTGQAELHLASVDIRLPMSDVFDGV